jgi:hypothetical protein
LLDVKRELTMEKKKSREPSKPKAIPFRPGGAWRGLKVRIREGLAIRDRGSEQGPTQRRGKG